MIGRLALRLAHPMARRPLAFVALGLLVCALGGIGFARWSVDPGTDLLVGRSSDLGAANTRFTSTYGGDPIVLVISSPATHADAFYEDTNLRRLTRLENDIAANPHVQSVVGPGTLMRSAIESVQAQITQALGGYDAFFQNLELLDAIQKAGGDASKVTTAQQQKAQDDATKADEAFLATIAAATQKADQARNDYLAAIQKTPRPGDRFLDAEEQAATDAAATVTLPPLFSEYVGGGTANDAAAKATLSTFAASYGDCLDLVAQINKASSSCQAFEWRFLLDLPHCPFISQKQFCQAKAEWSAVLPHPAPGGPSLAIVTVRLKASDTNDASAVTSVVNQMQSELESGLPNDSSQPTVALGAFDPTACPGRAATTAHPNTGCASDSKLPYTIAGLPRLTSALTSETRDLLVELLPIVVLAMVLILAGAFRVRGRMWPLLAAGAATFLTVGASLLAGTPLTPAVIAGVPVLVGLGVDYAVQLVARFGEERGGGLGVEAALRVTLTRTGPATLIAAAATIAGLAVLLVFAGIDAGPLVAIPLVAEFAGVLVVGVVLAWLAALLVALPAAAWVELRRDPSPEPRRRAGAGDDDERSRPAAAPLPALRGLSRRATVVLAIAALPAIAGWAVLSHVPVETNAERLLAPDLPELRDVQTVQAETGAANELDLFVEGDVAADASALDYQLDLDWIARCRTGGQIGTTFSIASLLDQLLNPASRSSGAPSSQAYPCSGPRPSQVKAARNPSPSPSGVPSASASPSASPAPTASGSPSAVRTSGTSAVLAAARSTPDPRLGGIALDLAAVSATTPAPTPTTAPTPPPTPASTAASTATTPATSPTPAPTQNPETTANLTLPPASVCALRLFSRLAASLVGPNGSGGIQPPPQSQGAAGTQPCPPPNVLLTGSQGLYQDPTPVQIENTRIAMTVVPASVADQAALIDTLISQEAALSQPSSISGVHTAGLVALAAQAYDTLTGRALLLNLLPLAVVAIVLVAIHREPRRALLPVLPAALAAGWGPLLILLFGRLPGDAGHVLGSLTPLTVVLGALVVALATEFGVVLLHRFHEERARGLSADDAAEAAVHATGRAVLVSAATLAAGFGVLALSGALPRGATSRLGFDWHSLPIVSGFGLTVVLDLALAVLGVFAVMLPVAVALERSAPAPVRVPVAPAVERAQVARPRRPLEQPRPRKPAAVEPEPVARRQPAPATPDPVEFVVREVEAEAAAPEPLRAGAAPEPPPRVARTPARPRVPGMSARRPRPEAEPQEPPPAASAGSEAKPEASGRARLPGVSGRRRAAPGPGRQSQAAPSEPPAPEAPARPRLPGGVTRRRPVEDVPVVTPPTPPSAPPEAAGDDVPPDGADEHPSGTEGATARGAASAPAGPPRHRRRRPPPHVRRQQRAPDDQPT